MIFFLTSNTRPRNNINHSSFSILDFHRRGTITSVSITFLRISIVVFSRFVSPRELCNNDDETSPRSSVPLNIIRIEKKLFEERLKIYIRHCGNINCVVDNRICYRRRLFRSIVFKFRCGDDAILFSPGFRDAVMKHHRLSFVRRLIPFMYLYLSRAYGPR